MGSLSIGDKAPDFSLFNTEKQAVTLSELKGQNVVLLFFPLAFTSTCTAELCGVRDDIANYSKLDAKVFGISVDSLFSLGKFKEEQGLNFDLLSDFNKTASTDYGSLYDSFVLGMNGVSKRSAFVVDKEGIIRYVEVLESAGDIPNLDAVKQVLAKL
jgi:peroxiredoxin